MAKTFYTAKEWEYNVDSKGVETEPEMCYIGGGKAQFEPSYIYKGVFTLDELKRMISTRIGRRMMHLDTSEPLTANGHQYEMSLKYFNYKNCPEKRVGKYPYMEYCLDRFYKNGGRERRKYVIYFDHTED